MRDPHTVWIAGPFSCSAIEVILGVAAVAGGLRQCGLRRQSVEVRGSAQCVEGPSHPVEYLTLGRHHDLQPLLCVAQHGVRSHGRLAFGREDDLDRFALRVVDNLLGVVAGILGDTVARILASAIMRLASASACLRIALAEACASARS